MAIVNLPGRGVLWPAPSIGSAMSPAASSVTIDTGSEMVAVIGNVWWEDAVPHDIKYIGYRTSGASSGSGSTYRVSLQSLDTTVGNPARPSGIVDQFYTGSFPTANAWNWATMSVARPSVSQGERLAVVFDFATFGTQSSVSIQTWGTSDGRTHSNSEFISTNLSGSGWSSVGSGPNVIVQSTSGSIGALSLHWPPFSVQNTDTFNSSSTSDERGFQFTVQSTLRINGLWSTMNVVTTASNFEAILYENNTAITSASIVGTSVKSIANSYFNTFSIPSAILSPNNTYRAVLKPTTANNIGWISLTIPSPEVAYAWWGRNSSYVTRTDAGAWASGSNTVPLIGIIINGVETAPTMQFAATNTGSLMIFES